MPFLKTEFDVIFGQSQIKCIQMLLIDMLYPIKWKGVQE
jgi:hypothetical protein